MIWVIKVFEERNYEIVKMLDAGLLNGSLWWTQQQDE